VKSNYIIREAAESDFSSIKHIWQVCFTNDLEYIDNFILHCLPYTKSWVAIPEYVVSKEAVAVLSLLPSYLINNEKRIEGGYIYGVATLPQHRGSSLSKLLMEKAVNHSIQNDLSYLVVKPATETLFDLYKKQGFDITLFKSLSTLNINLLNSYENPKFKSLTELNYNNNSVIFEASFSQQIQELFSLRENSTKRTLLWPLKILRYSVLETFKKGGILHLFLNPGSESVELYYLAYPFDENTSIIKVVETNICNKSELDIVIANIRTYYPQATTIYIEKRYNEKDSEILPIKSALIKILDNKISSDSISYFHLAIPME